ncbi:MAG: hypothetical protein LC748_13380, partial [Thermomicrobia bacterium]|nr:hypothetical protein [Thermomicrobia bacterium]
MARRGTLEPVVAAPAVTEFAPKRALAYVLLGFTMVVWGGSFVAARALLSPTNPGDVTLTPTVLAALRFAMASALFAPVLLARWLNARRTAVPVRRLGRGDLLRLLGLGQV